MTINPISETKYNSKIFSRHGSSFKKWWLQEKKEKKSYSTPSDNNIELNKDCSITLLYVPRQEKII